MGKSKLGNSTRSQFRNPVWTSRIIYQSLDKKASSVSGPCTVNLRVTSGGFRWRCWCHCENSCPGRDTPSLDSLVIRAAPSVFLYVSDSPDASVFSWSSECMPSKGVCFLRCSALLVSVQVHIQCRWMFCPPILLLLLLPEPLLSDCYPHHQSSTSRLWSAALLEGSIFLWICHQKDRPWNGSEGGPCLLVPCRGFAHPANLHCSSWECRET